MKRTVVFLSVIAISVASLGFSNVYAKSKLSKKTETIIEKYNKQGEQGIKKILKEQSKKQLIEDVNELSKDLSQTDFTPIALEVIDRIDEFDYTELTQEIQNENNSEEFSNLMVDAFLYKNNKDQVAKSDKTHGRKAISNTVQNNQSNKELKALLKNKKVKPSVKSKIILDTYMDSSDVADLISYVNSGDERLSASSLKKLAMIDSKKAYDEASKIFNNRNKSSETQLIAAQKAMVKSLRKEKNKLNNKDFTATNMQIFSESNSDALKDSSIFSISEIKDIDAVRAIVENNKVDTDLKVYTIDYNFDLIKELAQEILLKDEYTKEDVDSLSFILNCMEIHPIVEINDVLVKLEAKTTNAELASKISEVIKNIELNGVNSVSK